MISSDDNAASSTQVSYMLPSTEKPFPLVVGNTRGNRVERVALSFQNILRVLVFAQNGYTRSCETLWFQQADVGSLSRQDQINPLPPSGCRPELEKNILEDLFSSVLLHLKKNITPLEI